MGVPLLVEARELSHRDGVLMIGAKTRAPSSRWQEIADGALLEWKADRGVSPSTIVEKARSLRGTMLVVDVDRLVDCVVGAGWSDPVVLFRWHGWTLLGAWHS